MDGETFRESVAEAKATELARLDSDDLLLAVTDGARSREAVLHAAANSEHAAAETFRTWVADAANDVAREAFTDVVAQEEEHYGRVVDHLDAHDPPDSPGPMHAYLRQREGTVERVATGMVARPMVSARAHGRVIDFFAARDDAEVADLFRALAAETEAVLEDGLALLDSLCVEDDWERARLTAEYAIQLAHDDVLDSYRALDIESPEATGDLE